MGIFIIKEEQKQCVETRQIAPEEDIKIDKNVNSMPFPVIEVANKIQSINFWICQRTGNSLTPEEFLEELPKGEFLLEFAKTFDSSIGKVYKNSTKNYRHMDNISRFCAWLVKIKFAKELIFDSVDLYESKNIPLVIRCILCLVNYLNQKNVYKPLLYEPVSEFSTSFKRLVCKNLGNGYHTLTVAIVKHSLNDFIESDDFVARASSSHCKYESWNLEFYNKLVNPSNINFFENLQLHYSTKGGREMLESILFERIKLENPNKIGSKEMICYEFLKKFQDEIIKFPSLYIKIQFECALHNKWDQIVPTDLILNLTASEHSICAFIENLMLIDDSENYSLTLVPLIHFFGRSLSFKELQNGISAITCNLDSSIDPISIGRDMKNRIPKQNFNLRRNELIKVFLDDPHVSNELFARINEIKRATDRLIDLIDNFNYPEYVNVFLKKICETNNISKRDAMGLHFEYLIAPLILSANPGFIPKELIRIIFKKLKVFEEKVIVTSSKSQLIKYYETLFVISDADHFLISPFKNYIEERQRN